MSQAEQDRRKRAFILAGCDEWDRPASAWEAAMVAEVGRLPVVPVGRVPAAQLVSAGMRLNECHDNAIWYAANDPSGRTRHVVGWWPHADLLLLHSVVESAGRYWCITPQAASTPEWFSFIPDAGISWTDEPDGRVFRRGGQPIGPGLRIAPAAYRAAIALMRERLAAGMAPDDATWLADREASERLHPGSV